MQISRMIFKIFKNFLKFLPNLYAKGTEKERKRNGTVPFCVPLILEAFVPASFLLKF